MGLTPILLTDVFYVVTERNADSFFRYQSTE